MIRVDRSRSASDWSTWTGGYWRSCDEVELVGTLRSPYGSLTGGRGELVLGGLSGASTADTWKGLVIRVLIGSTGWDESKVQVVDRKEPKGDVE